MTRAKKKEWLEKAWSLQAEIEHYDWIIKDVSIYSSPGLNERVASSGGNNEEKKVAGKLAEVAKAQKDRDKAMEQLNKRKLAINNLKDGTQKKILWLHYKWEDVCYAVSYSRSRCNIIHDMALNALRII